MEKSIDEKISNEEFIELVPSGRCNGRQFYTPKDFDGVDIVKLKMKNGRISYDIAGNLEDIGKLWWGQFYLNIKVFGEYLKDRRHREYVTRAYPIGHVLKAWKIIRKM